MNGKQLKNSILQWAIQGKLVPQDPNDEPASVLLERIRVEKAKFVKEKKIKKDKNESIIYRGDDNSYYEKILATDEVKCIDEEIPFEIPQGWEWCRLVEVGKTETGTTPSKSHPEYFGDYIPFLGPANILNSKIVSVTQGLSDIGVDYGRIVPKNTILQVCIGGSIGKCAITDKPVTFNQQINSITPYLCNVEYVHIVLQSEYFRLAIMDKATGTATPIINRGNWETLLFPLPPINEQERIVANITELTHFLGIYSNKQEELNKLNSNMYQRLKKAILQEAIQGKLVPQIAEEGTAQDLLKQIKEEKLKLVKEGKLKKSALNDSVIFRGDDNKYYERINGQIIEIELSFEYPNSWTVLRLKDICQLIDGEKRNGKGVCLDAKYLRGKSSSAIVEKGKFVYAGDNIILVDGENSGEVFLVPQDGYMGSTFKQLWLSSVMWKPYVLAFILFYKEELRNSKRGAAIPHLNKELFYNLPIGIPPLAEQQRITERVNELSQLLK
ncbi:restriction endonuclease subunit S [Paraprevotella clara]|uniref:restriction endonuclease subunit S n=1 Tax=Paraprevotella clara TaxID=454154 RepID=UPI004029882E